MAASPLHKVVQHLRRTVFLREVAGWTDGQLLGSFLSGGEQAAFEGIVRRHGMMVMGVCKRVLRNRHDAEDAFQATFLVLFRKAKTIVPRDLLGNWLHGVAYKTALKARARIMKQQSRERQLSDMPEPQRNQPDSWHDLLPLLDQELSRLPDKYRILIVLCDLEGKTRKEAARQLGCPEGTVAGRLARARTILAKRLTRHGGALSGGALASVLAQTSASAGLPPSLVAATVKAANLIATGQAAMISVPVAALTEGVLKAMLLTKIKTITAGLLLLTALGFGAGTLFVPTRADNQLVAHKQEKQKPVNGQIPKGQVQFEKKKIDLEKNDLADLQGTWKVMRYDKSEKAPVYTTMVFKGNKFTLLDKDGVSKTLMFKIDPTKKPKWFDHVGFEPEIEEDALDAWRYAYSPGIYQLNGDTLEICFSYPLKRDLPRPTEFKATEKSEPDMPGRALLVLRREKEQLEKDVVRTDEQRLQGVWLITRINASNFKTENPDNDPNKMAKMLEVIGNFGPLTRKYTFEGNKLIFDDVELIKDAKNEWQVENVQKIRRFKLNPATTPRQITLYSMNDGNEEEIKGIYFLDNDGLLDGDNLTICLNRINPDGKRNDSWPPAEFLTKSSPDYFKTHLIRRFLVPGQRVPDPKPVRRGIGEG